MAELKIGIISDLHCRHSSSEASINTFLFSDEMRRPQKQHPIESLIKLIDKENLTVDFLLCPGDITDKIDKQGLVTGWAFLEEIQHHLKAKYLLSSIGNHDIDSHRKHNTYNFLDLPKRLKDNYPFPFEEAKKSFYSDGFCVIEIDNVMFFIFNSVYSHSNESSANQSIITDDILEKIEEELGKKSDCIFKIAFTHHHPIKHSNVGFVYKDVDVIEKGDKLIEILVKNNFQIFIHGHKHEPRIIGYNSLPIFASGSFSSLANLQETNSKNYFHILKLKPKIPKGLIISWEFTKCYGWDKTNGDKILPEIGFGEEIGIDIFTKKVSNYFKKEKLNYLRYTDFLNKFPNFIYYYPYEQEKIKESLKLQHSIAFNGNDSGKPIELIHN